MPIDVPAADDCSFCEYLAGRRRYTILERLDDVAMLVTREQRGIGHVLVIPVAHRVTILDVSPSEAAALIVGVQRAARAVVAAYDPAGISIWQNNGVPSHQSVPHVHVHVHVTGALPGGGTEWGEVPRLSVEETDLIAERLRPHLS